MGKKVCKHSELKEKGKQLADLRDTINDLNHRRMDRGLTESDQDRMDRLDRQYENLRNEIGECGEDPDLYEEIGMKEIEKEEDESENEDIEEAED